MDDNNVYQAEKENLSHAPVVLKLYMVHNGLLAFAGFLVSGDLGGADKLRFQLVPR